MITSVRSTSRARRPEAGQCGGWKEGGVRGAVDAVLFVTFGVGPDFCVGLLSYAIRCTEVLRDLTETVGGEAKRQDAVRERDGGDIYGLR